MQRPLGRLGYNFVALHIFFGFRPRVTIVLLYHLLFMLPFSSYHSISFIAVLYFIHNKMCGIGHIHLVRLVISDTPFGVSTCSTKFPRVIYTSGFATSGIAAGKNMQ
jgi:hypothetical protein